MTRGAPTPTDIEAKFRAHYLTTLNAAASARAVGLAERTGADIAQEIRKEPEFAAYRRELRARELDELVEMRMDLARHAREKAKAEEADVYPSGEGLTVVDKRPEWAKVLLDSEKNAHNLAKIEDGNSSEEGGGKTEVHIHLADLDEDKPSESDAEPDGQAD